MKINAGRPKDLTAARDKYYDKLAEHFLREIGSTKIRTILEAGCGRGQLTIPLLKKLPASTKMIAVDSSKGPYAGWLNDLIASLDSRGLEHRVRTLNTDVRHIDDVNDEAIDVVVSNELICDLYRQPQLRRALREFHRILRPGGIMVHGEWSSSPTSRPQGFLIRHWPTWNPDQLFVMMKEEGFHKFQVTYFDTTLHLGFENAAEELRAWGATQKLLKREKKLLRQQGIDLPFEHVLRCKKEG